MTSNILSRLLPPTSGSPSVYQTLRELDETSDTSDVEERAGLAVLDTKDPDDNFELDPALADTLQSSVEAQDAAMPAVQASHDAAIGTSRAWKKRGLRPRLKDFDLDEPDDEVPASLLIEVDANGIPLSPEARHEGQSRPSPTQAPMLGQAGQSTRAQWKATQERQQLHSDPPVTPRIREPAARKRRALAMIDPKEKAMWRWANVENLDNFLKEVYDYFYGNGIWSILLSRLLNLLYV